MSLIGVMGERIRRSAFACHIGVTRSLDFVRWPEVTRPHRSTAQWRWQSRFETTDFRAALLADARP